MSQIPMQIPASEQEVIDQLNGIEPTNLHLVRVDSDIDIDDILQDPYKIPARRPQSYLVVNGHIVELKISTSIFLKNFPKDIRNLSELRILLVGNCDIGSFLKNIGKLKKLVALSLLRCNLTTFPDTIRDLPYLRYLSLNRNKLNSLPESIGNLTNLKKLDISSNNLNSLPESIGNLINLTELNASGNNLNTLPESIGNLSNLKVLILYRNKILSLPEYIGNLLNLDFLALSGNYLSRLPESFTNLKCNSISLRDNPLRSLSNINLTNLGVYSLPIIRLSPKGLELLQPTDDDYSVNYDERMDDDHTTRIERDLASVEKYYEKSAFVLANKYCKDSKSLSTDELERLVWEAGLIERELLESRFPLENEVVRKINSRMKVELRNGYSLLL